MRNIDGISYGPFGLHATERTMVGFSGAEFCFSGDQARDGDRGAG